MPNLPGVYQMLDANSVVIYVGKATNLKKRVSQYFNRSHTDFKTTLLVKHIQYIEPIITNNSHDALILENQLIKKYQPRFNILLKDDKSYPYIKITTNEEFPRILITRRKLNDSAHYFGPYTSYGSTKRLLKTLYTLFPLRDCKQHIDSIGIQKKCIKLDLKQCLGPCVINDITDQYQYIVNQCIQFLSGKDRAIIDDLNDKMSVYASKKKYEKAAELRDKIAQLSSIQSQRRVELDSNDHHYFLAYASDETHHYFIAQHYRHRLFVSQFGCYESSDLGVEPFINTALMKIIQNIPNQRIHFVCDELLDSHINNLIESANITNIHTSIPKKGIRFDLLALVRMNAKQSLIGLSKILLKQTLKSPLLLLKQDLNLTVTPNIIFGCDISHFYGNQIVGSVVVFIGGKPSKQYYRHFNIKSIRTGKSNDPKAIHETVCRLIDHFSFYPDLLLIDGGKGQLNAALSAIKKTKGVSIQCISLAKRNEELFLPNQSSSVVLSAHHTGLNLLRHIRDESHRFALTFQRKKRTHSYTKTSLDSIEGLGPKRIKKLYQHFKTFDKIKYAKLEELCGVDLINEELARDIFKYFNN